MSAYGSGWSVFLKYKRLVRATLGASSRQYQGLRFRRLPSSSDDAGEAEAETDEGEVANGAPAAPESVAAPSAP